MLAEHVTSGNFRGSFQKYVSALSDTVKLKDELERLTYSARLLDHLLTYAIVSSPTPSVMAAQKSVTEKATSQRAKATAVVSTSVVSQFNYYNVTTFREMKSRNWKQLLQKNFHPRMDHSSTL